MSSGLLSGKDLSFNQIVAEVRRRFMMDAILASNPQRQAQGEKILRNVRDNLTWKRQNKSDQETTEKQMSETDYQEF